MHDLASAYHISSKRDYSMSYKLPLPLQASTQRVVHLNSGFYCIWEIEGIYYVTHFKQNSRMYHI